MIILDTHAWIWLASDPDRLGAKARTALHKAKSKMERCSLLEMKEFVALDG